MSEDAGPLLEWREVDGVTVVRVLSPELRHPIGAVELGQQVEDLLSGGGPPRLLLDLSAVQYMGSTGFATLLVLSRKAEKAGGRLKVCGMQPEVRFGANILGLPSVLEIHDDERSALGTF